MKKVIFTDFDGTITKADTCYEMVKAFAKDGWQEINKLWEEKKMSTAECANMTFGLFDAGIEDLQAFLDAVEIDDHFKNFISLCEDKGYDVFILSDGYDFNIKYILKKFNLDVKFYANKLLYDSSKGFSIGCPHENLSCGRCGTCKRTLIKKLTNEGDHVIYIGDGHSDMCPAEIADVVFAKDVLYNYCLEKGIEAVPFSDFSEIIASGII